MSSEKYVFVVCGAREHIDTLHFSIQYLRHFSSKEIIVITDSSRNEIPLEWDNIVDIKTPEHLNHHQASIYLKTSIHRYFALNGKYCYLDSDVIAVRDGVDDIFKMKIGPVTFCTDHCRMRKFSPYAVYDNRKRIDEHKAWKIVEKAIGEYKALEKTRSKASEGVYWEKTAEFLETVFMTLERSGISPFYEKLFQYFVAGQPLVHDPRIGNKEMRLKLTFWVKYVIARLLYYLTSGYIKNYFAREENSMDFKHPAIGTKPFPLDFIHFMAHYDFYWDKEEKRWKDENGNYVFEKHLSWNQFLKDRRLIFNSKTQEWISVRGKIISDESDMLRKLIKKKFRIRITEPDWQHWNGGVFLFDRDSVEFMETWHKYTLSVFKDPKWMDRDQGTLIATAWKLGLQNNPTLPIEMNFLADYFSENLEYKGNFTFDLKPGIEKIQPRFLHIYHHFGDESWDLWNDVVSLNHGKTQISQPE